MMIFRIGMVLQPPRHIIPRIPHRHSRVGGKPQNGRVRHTGFKAVSTGQRNSYGCATYVIADLIRNPEGKWLGGRHSRVGGNPQGGVLVLSCLPSDPSVRH